MGKLSMGRKRLEIIPYIHGKITSEGKVSEPDMAWIIEKWRYRHPEFKRRRIRVTTGIMTTEEGFPTKLRHATVAWSKDIAEYDPADDVDLYEYWLADDQGAS